MAWQRAGDKLLPEPNPDHAYVHHLMTVSQQIGIYPSISHTRGFDLIWLLTLSYP